MSKRLLGGLAVVFTVVVLAPATRAGQEETYTPPHTEWGDPDLRGHWLPGAYQPMETPADDSWRPPEGANRGQGAAFSRFFEPDPETARPERVPPRG